MKKILLGVAVAVAAVMMTGCPGLGIDLDGNKYDATMKMDSTNIKDTTKLAKNSSSGVADKQWSELNDSQKNAVYQREWKRLGSLEKAQALETTITLDLDATKSILVNPDDATRKAVWGFAFDFDTNKKGSSNVDFCLVGMRAKSFDTGTGMPTAYEYYFERYINIPEQYNRANGGSILSDAGALGPNCSTMKNKTWDGNLYNCDTTVEESKIADTYINYKGSKSTLKADGADDWNELNTNYYTQENGKFVTKLFLTQETKGTYKVFLGKSDTAKVEIGTFGIKSGEAQNLTQQETNATNVWRYGPAKNGYLMGGIACYASCPYKTKLNVHFDTPKESIQGAIFAQPVE